MQSEKPMLSALGGKMPRRIPFWLMRQAGRYLPEYRELRARKKGFMAMAMDPVTACEITMQPIRRFGMDGAVIFSDILVIPHALGQKLEFLEGEGPKLDPIRTSADLSRLNFLEFEARLSPVYEAIARVNSELSTKGFNETALIGFSGAPWTLAAYMIEGHGSKDFMAAKLFALKNGKDFSALMDMLIEAVSLYLVKQVEAGAEVLQLFDSWAGVLDAREFQEWVIIPTRAIVNRVRKEKPGIPIIGFPRGAGLNYAAYAKDSGVTALGLDSQVPMFVAKELQTLMPVQGNLDPSRLLAGGGALEEGIETILENLAKGPLVFNLGHGVNKDTPVEHVETLVHALRNFGS